MTLFRSLYTYLVAAIVAVSPSSAMSGGDDNPLSQRAGYGMPGQAVDLGLSVLWSDHNVGATGPQDVGRFFGYGDITGTVTTCSYSDYVSQDVVGSDRDPAFVFWGGGWRMPTASEINELVERCEWKWVVKNGVPGYVVSGRNGSIFLPVTGQRSGKEWAYQQTRGYYWSGEISEANRDYAGALFFHKGGKMLKDYRKFYGFVIRPVKEEF
ncbi:MAG: hypothetical protein II375_04505 [Bacteroidales bacterium]|nr:hypothetical protein [Bacteroidales bacterium]